MEHVQQQLGRMGLHATKLANLLMTSGALTLTDEDLAACVGFSCAPGERGYSYLQSAIKHCESQGRTWRRIPRANAIERKLGSGTMDVAATYRKHIGKQARRAVRVLNTVDVAALGDTDKKRAVVEMAQLGTIAYAASSAANKQLEARTPTAEVDAKKLLEAMTNGKA